MHRPLTAGGQGLGHTLPCCPVPCGWPQAQALAAGLAGPLQWPLMPCVCTLHIQEPTFPRAGQLDSEEEKTGDASFLRPRPENPRTSVLLYFVGQTEAHGQGCKGRKVD